MGSQLCFDWIDNWPRLHWYSHIFVNVFESDKRNVSTTLLHGTTNFVFSVVNLKGKVIYLPQIPDSSNKQTG